MLRAAGGLRLGGGASGGYFYYGKRKIAAIEAGAIDAYVSPYDQNIYYLIRSAAGYDVTILSEGGDFKTIAQLDDQYECLSIRADADGNVFVLRKNRDETAKSDILHLGRRRRQLRFQFLSLPGRHEGAASLPHGILPAELPAATC